MWFALLLISLICLVMGWEDDNWPLWFVIGFTCAVVALFLV